MKAKWTLLTLEYPPHVGGVARYLADLVYSAKGELDVIVCSEQKFWRSHVPYGTWPRWWPMVKAIRSLSDQSGVIVSHVLPVGTAAYLAHLWGGPQYVVILHGTDIRQLTNPWKRWLARRICRSAVRVCVNSQSTANELRARLGIEHATVIYPRVSIPDSVLSRVEARRRLGISFEKRLTLSIARLVPRKGIDRTIEALASFQETERPLYIVMGNGEDVGRLQALATQMGVAVTWFSSSSDEEKWLWLAAADVFVLPGRDEGGDIEGFGIVYLEAAAAGIPSIAGNSGGAPEAVLHEKTGLVVDGTSVADITLALRRLLEESELRERLGKQAAERVRADFSGEDQWSTLIEALPLTKGEVEGVLS
jgi:phosphatidylinositol alpha-1,6-mannosyltransferase